MIERATTDTETRSHCDISRGLDVYLSHHTTQLVMAGMQTPTFRIMAAFIPSTEGRDALEAKMRAAGHTVVSPETLVNALRDTKTVVAHNFAFDQGAYAKLAGLPIPNHQWSCTMARAMRMGLPGGLGNLAEVLKFGDAGKDKEGSRLMKQLAKPRPAWTKWQSMTPQERASKVRTRKIAADMFGENNLVPNDNAPPMWFEDADRITREVDYCARDIDTTARIDTMLPELEPSEWAIWQHVHAMNLRGIPVDRQLIDGAIRISEEAQEDLIVRIKHYTSGMVQSLKSIPQLNAWAQRYGEFFNSWAKDDVAASLANPNLHEAVRVVAKARQEASRGSVAKYETAAEMVSTDGRLRHQVTYSGTAPTMRLAGRGWQPLNLVRPKIMADRGAGEADIKAGRPLRVPEWKLRYDPETALAAIRNSDLSALRGMGDPEEILSDNIRNTIEAPPGMMIVSPDLSAIEARGVFWISDCQKALEGYRRNEDLYCSLASTIVGFPCNKKDNPEERQLGKVGILQCGYGSGASRVAMANKIDEALALQIVTAYRSDYSEVKACWYELENAAGQAILYPETLIECCRGRVKFIYRGGWLMIQRPSGVWMYLPEAGLDREGRLYYHSWIKGAWREESIWGGVLINFVVQGFCRDLMYHAEMQLAQDPRYELFLQCYDSLSALVREEQAKELCDHMIRVMTTPPPWAWDMPLAAEGKPKRRYS